MGHLCPHGPVNLKLTLAPTSQPPISLACSVCARACAGAGATPTLTATLIRYKFWALQLWSHDNGFGPILWFKEHTSSTMTKKRLLFKQTAIQINSWDGSKMFSGEIHSAVYFRNLHFVMKNIWHLHASHSVQNIICKCEAISRTASKT